MREPELTRQEFKALFDQYFESIRNFIYYRSSDIDLAEDLVQEAFLKLWENRHSVKRETLKSYLYTIANNLLINQFKKKRTVFDFVHKIKVSDHDSENPEFLMETSQFQEYLDQVLESIPEHERVVFLMNRIEQLKYKEIAERLNISVKAVEKRMSKALEVIKKKIKTPI